jgi:DHA2 family methylenomycin A resistance protein-like MFS transporter
MVILDTTIANVALPSIGEDFGTGIAGLQWVADSYLVVLAACILSGGALADRYSARTVFRTGVALFVVTSVEAGLAANTGALILARVLQGAAAALCVPASLSLVRAAFADPAARRWAIGMWGALAAVAAAAGPLVGGLAVSAWSWRAVFLVNLPIGVVVLHLTRRHLGRTCGIARRLDLLGQALAITSLGASTIAVIDGAHDGIGAVVWIAASVGVLAGVTFVYVESKIAEPMLPLQLFRSPVFAGGATIGVLINFAFYGELFVLNLYFQHGRDASALEAGLAVLPQLAVVALGSTLSAHFSLRVNGTRGTAMLGLGLAAAGDVSLLALLDSSDSYRIFVLPLAAIGLGMGLLMPAVTAALTDSAPGQHAGLAAGVINAARQAGSVLGIAVLGGLIGAVGSDLLALRWTLALAALAFGTALAIAARCLPRPPCEFGRSGIATGYTSPTPVRVNDLVLAGVGAAANDHVHHEYRRALMSVSVGDPIPDVEVSVLGEDGMPVPTSTKAALGGGKVVLFAVPGAFTPACSTQHLPSYVAGAESLAGKGVTTVACISVNDAWVMEAWAQDQGATGKILMLGDGNARFTEAMGLVLDGAAYGLGKRSQRYAAVIEDGVITRLEVEPDVGVSVSACEFIIAGL